MRTLGRVLVALALLVGLGWAATLLLPASGDGRLEEWRERLVRFVRPTGSAAPGSFSG